VDKRTVKRKNASFNNIMPINNAKGGYKPPLLSSRNRRLFLKTKTSLRDLRVGAFYPLDFGKGEKSAECRVQGAECRVKSLSVSRLPKP
jgi:hypothetical protein